MGVIGIFLSLALLMLLAYRGINVLIPAPLLALLATYTQVFMPALGAYLLKFFPLFLLGAIFGKLMADSGSARAIAEWFTDRMGTKHAIAAVVMSCGVLTYGGVSLFVVAFAVYPTGNELFQRSGTPKRLLPAALALGSFTFTMTALPGTPAIQNAIPMPYFNTTPFAAPIFGTLARLGLLIGGIVWLNRRRARAVARNEGYGEHAPTESDAEFGHQTLPAIWLATIPVVSVILLNALFTYVVIPAMDTGYLAEAAYGGVGIGDVRGIWAIIASMAICITIVKALNWSRFDNIKQSFNRGTFGSLLPVFNTAS